MLKTALHRSHVELGAKMGEFAGYDMPLYYDLGVMKEHEWVRSKAGLFDVSHMGQAMVTGQGAREFIETITPSSFEKLALGRTKYTVLTSPEGGIIDDLMITHCMEDGYHFVLNAGCKDKDIAWIKQHMPDDLTFTHHDEWALIALQGPDSEQVMKEVLGYDLSGMPYMAMRAEEDNSFFISRLGYTGEDGFELAVKNDDAPALWDKLLAHDSVQPIGLAARDSLRLEMGYALYGHDIDDTTSPIEADLAWVTSKNNTGFIGAETVLKHKQEGVQRKRVGIKLTEKGVAREGAEIRNENDEKIGELTSGGFSPTLQHGIGQGYVDAAQAEAGTKVFVNVRGRNIAAEVATMPFVPASTKSMKQKAA